MIKLKGNIYISLFQYQTLKMRIFPNISIFLCPFHFLTIQSCFDMTDFSKGEKKKYTFNQNSVLIVSEEQMANQNFMHTFQI